MEPGRIVLGIGWSLALVGFLRAGRRAGWGRWFGALLAGFAVGCAFARWHVDLLHAVRAHLQSAGVYLDRLAFKAVLGVVLALLAVWALRRVRRGVPEGVRTAVLGALAGAVYLLAQTMFLDDVLPRVLAVPPGRWWVEGVFVAWTLWGLRQAARHRAD